ncbi:MAG: RHS repeat-associated core domain-containing protein, partial [Burkholderiales bacterium]|nr:RHS repeat-associated core domain-containing protein [Burkholderiales bacterium]
QQDALMSVTGISSHDGSPVWSADYTTFGDRLIGQTGTSANRLQYTGRELDSTGLYYYRARYYDPSIGRFLSEDPLGFAAGINFYAYVGNNPVNANDPSGKEGVGLVGLAGAGIGAAIGGLTNLGAQLSQNGGDLANLNWPNVGWSAATGGAAGYLMTTSYGQRWAGVAGIGAGTNVLNYYLTTPSNEQSAAGYTAAAVSGAVGAFLGGKAPNQYMFISPSPALNDLELIGMMVTKRTLGMGMAGGFVGAVDWPKAAETLSTPVTPSASISPSSGSGSNGSFMDMVNSNPAAAGGFLLYPNKPNTNQMQSVYSKR